MGIYNPGYEKAVLVRFRGEREQKTLEEALELFKTGDYRRYRADSNNQKIIRALEFAVEKKKEK